MSTDIYDKYEIVIGLEIHIQLNTKTKAYCADVNEFGSAPNTNVSMISLGHPGTLPKINAEVVNHAIKLGLACGCNITEHMHFDRKNYFYADLPKGYQITQDKTPICTGGFIDIKTSEGDKRINITRIHMEEDAGKSMHDQDPFDTLVDLNRAGVPLLEIVSEPEMRSSEEAYHYLAYVRKLVRYLNICDGNMEEGSMRCDANVSVRIKGETELGTRAEVKNMNSLRNVQRAIEFEAKRQIDLIEENKSIRQETRSFDATNGTTFSLRGKELANDYRYFPEPDLAAVHVTDEHIARVKATLPPLPNELFARYTKELGLSEYDANVITETKEIALFFEEIIKHTNNYKAAANWLMVDIKSYLNQYAIEIDAFLVEPKTIAALIDLIDSGKISSSSASQKLFPLLIGSTKSPKEIAIEHNLMQDSSDDDIIKIAEDVIAAWPEKSAEYKNGNKGLLGLFMGEFMKAAKGKANPKKANQIIREILDKL
ncbi:MAG: aspartyl-tRNA(Asn)/glutamyl-tRNA(Gln) amidotransferase subunit B [Flavobacteriales bacterium]|jgi:aspartyl-tRNA(Asn)/glutamyl-tRNA(Gln) amidotransferase subunit B